MGKSLGFKPFGSVEHASGSKKTLLEKKKKKIEKKENQCSSKILNQNCIAPKFALAGIPSQNEKVTYLINKRIAMVRSSAES